MPSGARGEGVASVDASRVGVFFDVDGTLVSTHIVHQYIHVRKVLWQRYGGAVHRAVYPFWLGAFALRCLEYVYLDRVSRTRMNIAFYRNYAGLDTERVRAAAAECLEGVFKPHLFSRGVSCVGGHLAAGRRVVLVTGSIDFLMAPLARHLEGAAGEVGRVDLIARTLEARGGRFTGRLDGPPIGQEEKARQMRVFADRTGIDLRHSLAYGDSIADLAMLEAVGHPHVVNADRQLRAVARRRGWPVHQWDASGNGA